MERRHLTSPITLSEIHPAESIYTDMLQVFPLAMRHFFSPDLFFCRESLASSASWVANLVAIIRYKTANVIEFSVFVSCDVCVHPN